ncbi:Oidioi.mRNA.OKI2018_I69.PAR.g10368.t1.cds [Oikopleura dioica]|uniref:Oidioi.mRNA.OKI2018_I69.PAR.g10368.t1.cds n=1 Tax=Oikopleura dioica TaxID=34765 RepID=A0ABN7RQ68_OIKDI|nr:Oidioi.mRNA.OKI2018_I69.PAR.g10368.t1.cds [Oikopleura dioica]
MTVSVQVDVENTNVEHSTAANKENSPVTPRPVEQTALLTTEEQPQDVLTFMQGATRMLALCGSLCCLIAFTMSTLCLVQQILSSAGSPCIPNPNKSASVRLSIQNRSGGPESTAEKIGRIERLFLMGTGLDNYSKVGQWR